jgi:hypothetical protein
MVMETRDSRSEQQLVREVEEKEALRSRECRPGEDEAGCRPGRLM